MNSISDIFLYFFYKLRFDLDDFKRWSLFDINVNLP